MIRKAEKPASRTRTQTQPAIEEEEESESGEEFEDNSEDDISSDEDEEEDEDEEDANIDDYTPGRYVLFKYTKRQYYVSSIVEVADGRVVLKAARKYGDHNGKITFCWPSLDDIFPVNKLCNENATALPDPVIDRRGSSLIFKKSAFRKVSLINIM